LADGGNAASVPDGNHIWVDCDGNYLGPLRKEIFGRTLVIKSAKGYGACFTYEDSPLIKRVRYLLNLHRLIDEDAIGRRVSCPLADIKASDRLVSCLARFGAGERTAVKLLNLDGDGKSYYVVIGTTCVYDGSRGVKVRYHSGTFANYCNSSPNHRHKWVPRTFYNKTTQLMPFTTFLKLIGWSEG
jgi:hypothetical protein